jgi:integrase
MATFSKYEGKGKISWTAKVRKGGRYQRATFPSKKQAEDWSRELESQIVNEKYFPERAQKSARHTVGELIDLYLERIVPQKAPETQRKQRSVLGWWREVLGDTPLSNLTVTHLEDYKYLLMNQKHYAPATVNLFLNMLSQCFTYAASPRLGWMASNPFQYIKRFPLTKRMPHVTDEELNNLLWYCGQSRSPFLYLFVRLTLASGGRHHSEILSLRWRQINFRQKTILFINTKGKEDRVVPLDKATLQLLSDHYERMFPEAIKPDNWQQIPVFLSTRKPGQQVQSIFDAWQNARKKANLTWLHIHDLRHIFASRTAEKGGADIATLAELLGHKNIKYTQRYRHVTQNHNAAIVEKMGQATFQRDFDLLVKRSAS